MDFKGQPPVVRVWRPMLSGAPVCVIPCSMLAGIDDICSDSDTRRVCILGKEAQRKQQMISIWSIPLPSTTGKAPVCKPAELIAKQDMGADATVLHHRVFVATACGRVVQLNYNTRQVENVYRLYEDGCPIWAITVTEGFVSTAGDDGYVRVWPLDFTNYYMQAKLPGPVLGLDLTPDDLQLVCSVQDGSVGVLDLEACKYSVVCRSHKSGIRCGAVSTCGTKMCTAAMDGCIRVWDIDNGVARTLLDFKAEPDLPVSLAFQPAFSLSVVEDGETPLLSVGFDSGAVMIFEISAVEGAKSLSPLFELKHHASPGRIVIYDEARRFEATRCPEAVASKPILPVVPSKNKKDDDMIRIQPPTFVLRGAGHHHHNMVALYSHERAIALARLPDFEVSRVLRLNSMQSADAAITTYTFSVDGALLLVGLSDSWVRVYDPDTGLLEHSINCVLAGMITGLYMSATLRDCDGSRKIITAGHLDHQLRVSDYYRDARSDDPLHRPAEQTYHAHHFPPREVFSVGEVLITLSSAEVCIWSFPYHFTAVESKEQLRGVESRPVETGGDLLGCEKVTVEGRGLFQSMMEGVDEGEEAPPEVERKLSSAPSEAVGDDAVVQLDTADVAEEEDEEEGHILDVPMVADNNEEIERSEALGKITYKHFCSGGEVVLWLSELGHLATGCHRWVHLGSLVEDRDTFLTIPDSIPGPRRIHSLDLSPLTMRTLLASADDGRWVIVWDLVKAGVALAPAEDGAVAGEVMSKFVEPLSATKLPQRVACCKLLADSLAVSCGRRWDLGGEDQGLADLIVWGLPRTESCKEAKVLATANLQLPERPVADVDIEIVVNPLSAMEFVTMTSDSVIMWQLATSEEGGEEARGASGWGLAFNEVPIPQQHEGTLCSLAMLSPHLFVGTVNGFVMLVDTDVCVLAWTTVPIEKSQSARLARLASVPLRNGTEAFCATLSGGHLWAGYIRKQPAVRCVMQSTWMVKGLSSAVCLSHSRVVAAGEKSISLLKIGATPAPLWTHDVGFAPLRLGLVGLDLIGVVGQGSAMKIWRVEGSAPAVLVENMCIPVPWTAAAETGAILCNGEGQQSSCWYTHDAMVAESLITIKKMFSINTCTVCMMRLGRVGLDLIGVVGQGSAMKIWRVEGSAPAVLVENMCIPVPWTAAAETGAILCNGEGQQSSCWYTHDAMVAELLSKVSSSTTAVDLKTFLSAPIKPEAPVDSGVANATTSLQEMLAADFNCDHVLVTWQQGDKDALDNYNDAKVSDPTRLYSASDDKLYRACHAHGCWSMMKTLTQREFLSGSFFKKMGSFNHNYKGGSLNGSAVVILEKTKNGEAVDVVYSVVNSESLDASGVVKALGGSEDQASLAAKKADEAVDKYTSERG
ncbi:hypothetical protein Pmar_PMAR025968 [Perkinsus marinus ATCC 50983]|uniref:Uncharacterized protein n=1 Tax=Perkinsus marinus (strain ATCC 50983 / TXsc) TaxID=423536 RepID=C5L1I6_PERM5|nr:hypothetical protein Pmar_PMAR025968 [Perkinsus marinus ATCC 50983]EER09413.1 hypothetical protein Pmar_PMAR025968 [Perkinsus marinus ATCC 50983]|eukprot:XP_002777597.1 hypothetical protein Pmar_PMAR025968 [Perkinsus marinus ATCC 50983]